MEGLSFRSLRSDDFNEVQHVCRLLFPLNYSDEWYRDITSSSKYYTRAGIDNLSRIIALIIVEIKSKNDCQREDYGLLYDDLSDQNVELAYVLSLGVIPDYRRCGIASFLLTSLIRFLKQERLDCKAVYLHVLTSNIPAINFYEYHKFQLFKYLPQYYLISNQSADGYCYVCYINGGKGPIFIRITYPFRHLLINAITVHLQMSGVIVKLTNY
ncbi:uncharacterized protein TRIADDRAFT_20891 [Trichoplax adhaerens]|uniref:N-alpha-acetyltransferase 60 n=1 Tax=Trichoplax adhaerens TaxID=10228 RepID=B3RN61_TRIAD|nr:hypothetical protein TRIADDRAFT_20891 [Trichoplax adhaerens]EDV27399.1 hypothetical protein TRIADDRAFT_20891 [Trichoplax adhaerens]|eukprot:XP_002109233.1 hypothetical protein TRIADDRAFT_20891 [Trichoplax adhaerens]